MLKASKERRIFFTAFLLCSMLVLASCSYLQSRNTSSDSVAIPRTAPTTDTKREACARACSHEHDICNDGPASRNQTFDAPQQFVGAGAACDQSLRDCLKYCK